jgi:Head domain of trimeric autotransporter adhesin/Chaperone of endosialidase
MKRIPFLTLVVLSVCSLKAQNVGIGTTDPQNKLQVQGSLLVTEPNTATSTAPTAGQIKTMVNASTISFVNSDSTGRIYDPGGPGGSYLANMTANASINNSSSLVGIELTVETMDLATGDSLIIKEHLTGDILMAVGNGYTNAGKWVFNSTNLYIIFKSNADANNGAGFSLLFRKLYNTTSSQTEVSGFAGNGLFYDTKSSVLRSGFMSNAPRGTYSVALGYQPEATHYATAIGLRANASGFGAAAIGNYATASGTESTAIGSTNPQSSIRTTASGAYSIAIGTSVRAQGINSVALGGSTIASGISATAIGYGTTASGSYSTAMGVGTIASGDNSTAIGNSVSTNNFDGALIIGDNSTNTVLNIATSNSFRARFDGGYRFFTSAAAINAESCQLPAGGNAWITASDFRLKEKVTIANGEDFLKKISLMKLGSWNYISQNPLKQRHYGPMAQDFYAAFGKDEFGTIGNDTTINSADFDGVNLIAIQALEKRTQKIEQLEKENEELRKMMLQLRKEMDELKK